MLCIRACVLAIGSVYSRCSLLIEDIPYIIVMFIAQATGCLCMVEGEGSCGGVR